jgi:hypothetical protein
VAPNRIPNPTSKPSTRAGRSEGVIGTDNLSEGEHSLQVTDYGICTQLAAVLKETSMGQQGHGSRCLVVSTTRTLDFERSSDTGFHIGPKQ